jgi:excisionase family DNA binding protein
MSKSAVKSYTIPEAARAMRCTLKYIYDLVYSGKIGATKVAGRWRIPAVAVEERIRKREGRVAHAHGSDKAERGA